METSVRPKSLQRIDNMSMASIYFEGEHAAVKTNLTNLLSGLSSDKPWGIRQSAANRLGYIGDRRALPKLLETLPGDPFWMVRQAIIQALEKIGDVKAIPLLEKVAKNDSFAVVRSYAAKAIERISNSQN